ncbi:hypothetical protein [uncultured Gimesia sp.]|uniref:hypothetical protein n=1 Tax=uncultured Gimesia sp. TaxID=1678688 RepID=UPI0030DBF818|tara:strand:+ start:288494 stop:290845 length:2352 start_codon:yes stop_codon:yes gene_type:complete
MIKVECDSCFQEYKVRDERAGQTLKCKSCGHKMRVPSGDEDLLDDVYHDFEDPARPARNRKSSGTSNNASKKNKKSEKKTNGPIGTIVGVVCFAVAFYVSYTFVGGLFGKKKNEEAAVPPAIVQNEAENPSTAPAVNSPAAASPQQTVTETKPSEPLPTDPAARKKEIDRLLKETKGYADAFKKATNHQERKTIYEKTKIAQARLKTLQKQRKSENDAKLALNSKSSASKKSLVAQKWSSLVDPPLVVTKWPDSSKISIDMQNREENPILPHSYSPFIALRHSGGSPYKIDVWNLATEEKVGLVTIPVPDNQMVIKPNPCLSVDGKYLMMSYLTSDTKIPLLACWDVATGKKVAEWEADLANSINTVFEICGTDRAFAKILRKDGNRFKSILKLWDLTTGKLLNEKELDGGQITASNYKISPGGKFLIANNYSNLNIYDLNSLEQIYVIKFSKVLPADFHFVTVNAIEFSANGKELGLLIAGSRTTSVWVLDLSDNEFKLGYQVSGNLGDILSTPRYEGNHLTWNPTGNSWLLYGAWLVDRQSQRVVWTLKPVPNVIMRDEVFLTPNYLLAETATALSDANGRILLNRKPKLVSLPLSESKIAESLAAYASQSEAILGTGQKVSVDVNIGDVKFSNADEVKTILNDVIQQRLESEGFQVVPDQPIVFRIEYQEQDGHKLQLTKRDKSVPGNPLRRKATGKTLQSTAATFKLSWVDKPSNKILWSNQALVNPRFLILRGAATAEAARKKMFEELQNRLMAESIPYFIPKQKTLSMLPGETQLPD